ncbi:MAG: cupin domain-containing protein, partial [Solirubrobacterales bacterium]|nr:cupin domain-containing protein [Solirubrobacterales bacterium]
MRRRRGGLILRGIEPQFTSFRRLAGYRLADGATARALFGQAAMLNLVELEPESVVKRHSHPHEQLGLVLRGSMTLNVDGTDHVLEEFDCFALPGGV